MNASDLWAADAFARDETEKRKAADNRDTSLVKVHEAGFCEEQPAGSSEGSSGGALGSENESGPTGPSSSFRKALKCPAPPSVPKSNSFANFVGLSTQANLATSPSHPTKLQSSTISDEELLKLFLSSSFARKPRSKINAKAETPQPCQEPPRPAKKQKPDASVDSLANILRLKASFEDVPPSRSVSRPHRIKNAGKDPTQDIWE